MFPSIEDPKQVYYIVLDLPQDKLEKTAQSLEYPVKLVEQSLKFKYMTNMKSRYEPFRTKDKQELILAILKK